MFDFIKMMRRVALASLVVTLVSVTLYANRVVVMDLWSTYRAPEIPEAITFDRVQEQGLVTGQELGTGNWELDGEEGEQETISEEILPELVEVTEEEGEMAASPGAPRNDGVDMPDATTVDILEAKPVPTLPLSINLAVPFTPQAPHANWDLPYQEGCEEASVYMVERFYEGEPEGLIEAGKADKAILSMVAFQEGLYGSALDTTVEQTGVFAEVMFGRTYEIIDNPTLYDIQVRLAAGYPVIVPAAGRLLSNPYFTAPGPLYHMLVIRGYTEDGQFIVNDPGTRRGEAYLYDFDTLMNAMHDWNLGDEITEGKKAILMVYP